MSTTPHYEFERAAQQRGFQAIAGVDEVGRGPLAGPVTAAAVILDPQLIPSGLNDSKALSAKRRLELYEAIMMQARAVAIGFASAQEIDAINIRQATFVSMRRALNGLSLPADFALIDGNALPPSLPCAGQTIIKGDGQCLSIAAASIIAKVTRDQLMVALGRHYPHYDFAQNAGYPTEKHRAALIKYGPTAFHRLSFAPLKGAKNSHKS
jgi:ribonuclease HII